MYESEIFRYPRSLQEIKADLENAYVREGGNGVKKYFLRRENDTANIIFFQTVLIFDNRDLKLFVARISDKIDGGISRKSVELGSSDSQRLQIVGWSSPNSEARVKQLFGGSLAILLHKLFMMFFCAPLSVASQFLHCKFLKWRNWGGGSTEQIFAILASALWARRSSRTIAEVKSAVQVFYQSVYAFQTSIYYKNVQLPALTDRKYQVGA